MDGYEGKERRRSPRISDGITVRIANKDISGLIPAINISNHGALLRTHCVFDQGELLDLSISLPPENDPLSVKARVVRTVMTCSAWGFSNFDIGVDFQGLIEPEREKLSKTIAYLVKKIKTKS